MVSIIYIWDEEKKEMRSVLSSTIFPEDGGYKMTRWENFMAWLYFELPEKIRHSARRTKK